MVRLANVFDPPLRIDGRRHNNDHEGSEAILMHKLGKAHLLHQCCLKCLRGRCHIIFQSDCFGLRCRDHDELFEAQPGGVFNKKTPCVLAAACTVGCSGDACGTRLFLIGHRNSTVSMLGETICRTSHVVHVDHGFLCECGYDHGI